MNRTEFIELLNSRGYDTDISSPLWIPEKIQPESVSVWFVARPWAIDSTDFAFFEWIVDNCRGPARCYLISDLENHGRDYEYWGFAYEDDAVLFTLRWL